MWIRKEDFQPVSGFSSVGVLALFLNSTLCRSELIKSVNYHQWLLIN